MLTSNDKLEIFENFYIDRDLPKFKRQSEMRSMSTMIIDGADGVPTSWNADPTTMIRTVQSNMSFREEDRRVVDYMKYLCDNQPSLYNKLRYFVISRFVFTKHGVGKKARAKDPILFGMIANSDKLYFVADWTDDYCDLTLDKMLKVIGKDVLKVNAESLKSRIEKITVKEDER